jgi:S-DNA-T family DNA segregation ATPase FtsK/SpoIIIE
LINIKLSPERWLDLSGGVLALGGLLTLLSLFSVQRGWLTGLWVGWLYALAGWGGLILPFLLLGLGLWLLFRNVDKLPLINVERLSGLAIIFWVLLGFMHLLQGGGWELAAAGEGGGFLGALITFLFVKAVGQAGAYVLLLAFFLLGLVFTFDVSTVQIFRWLRELLAQLRRPAPEQTALSRVGESGKSLVEPQTAAQRPARPAAASGGLRTLPPVRPQGVTAPQSGVRPPAYPVQADSFEDEDEEDGLPEGPMAEGEVPEAGQGSSPVPQPAWVAPSIEAILDPADPVFTQVGAETERAKVIEETLAAFGTPGHVVEIHSGPTITQFGVEPDFVEGRGGRTRVRVSKIVGLSDDLALALAAPRIRIQAPVPGRNYIGIEVPNTEVVRVLLREIMESEPFQRAKTPLRFALGKDVSGKPISADLASMPHLLIAGTTGSGKSVCVNSILSCFLINNSPADLRLVLVDPKRVELTGYNGIPHLLSPVITDASRVGNALQWMLREMDSRYHKFAQAGTRNLLEYNHRRPDDHLPYIVIVIDELADLMMVAPEETERSITRLAQLARATGIHMILATQRPSTDVVTGLIKANFPSRIAFAVASNVDSRVILDQPGAERLLGRGDMLFQAPDASGAVRLQGVYVSDAEIQRMVEYWRMAKANTVSVQNTSSGLPADALPSGVPLKQAPLWDDENGPGTKQEDPLLTEAVDLVRREGRASITMLQRRLRIGYTRAARLVDTMEQKGIVGAPQANSQMREVLDYGPVGPPPEDPND